MGVILERKKRILLNEPHLVTTAPAGIANFSTDLIAPLKSCKVEFSPVQSGSGDPSQNNVRPISGWTGCNTTRCGKNLYNSATDTQKTYIRANEPVGEIIYTTYNYNLSDYIAVEPNTTYTINYNATTDATAAGMVFFGSKNAEDIIDSIALAYQTKLNNNSTSYTFTTEQNCNYLRFSTFPAATNIQLEKGSTATPYEPYTGQTIPVTWSSAGTIYGGYVDLITGKVVKTTAMKSYNGSADWQAVGNKFYCPLPYTDFQNSTDISAKVCNMYPFAEVIYYGSAVVTQNKHFYLQRHDEYINYCRVWVYDTGYSLSQFKALLNQTPLVFTYPVTESVVSLDPVTLKTLRGVNNIWSDTNGNTTVKYWAH